MFVHQKNICASRVSCFDGDGAQLIEEVSIDQNEIMVQHTNHEIRFYIWHAVKFCTQSNTYETQKTFVKFTAVGVGVCQ
jgi:hypothetical protein